MGKTPDRFPGVREEEEIRFTPTVDPPTEDGSLCYTENVGFSFKEEGAVKTLSGDAITPIMHESANTLVHNVKADSYTVVTYESGKIVSEEIFTDDTMEKLIRETSIVYSGTKIVQSVEKQYDYTGSLQDTYTEDYTYNPSDQIIIIGAVRS